MSDESEPLPPPTDERSRYTYRHLTQLTKFSVDSPLRVIAHVDLDAFYAQCEMKRLGVGPDVPLAVQQWANLIAVNYPARSFGVSRHVLATDALKLCPTLQLVHVAVWRAGSSHWAYEALPDMAAAKACLDPYRAASAQILATFARACGPDVLIEKASIDESFLDLSCAVHARLVDRYAEVLRGGVGAPGERLPAVPVHVRERGLDWAGASWWRIGREGGGGKGGGEGQEGKEDVDWDDVVMAIGAEIVRDVRKAIRDELGFTCSAGISNNKMLAKLGSGYRKPDQQSVVRVSAVQPFLNTFEFTKIRNLGGKLGSQISAHFQTTSLPDLLLVSLPKLSAILSPDTATWVYNVIRGHDRSAVTPRTAIKSMLSAKSFRPPHLPSSLSEARKWLQVFEADISSRLDDDRRPRVMSMSFSNKAGSRSRQMSIPAGGPLELSRCMDVLLKTMVGGDEGMGMWPCTRLSVDVSAFEEKEAGTRQIGTFLIRGDEAREVNMRRGEGGTSPPAKKIKTDEGGGKMIVIQKPPPGIASFFKKNERAASPPPPQPHAPLPLAATPEPEEAAGDNYVCAQCVPGAARVPLDNQAEHDDWHYARSLMMEERERERGRGSGRSSAPPPPKRRGGGGRGRGGGGGMEKGQRRLAFG